MNKIFAEDPSSDSELISITPSINLVDVSSNAGYNDVAAAADITDNSTDAQADTVWVTIGIHKGKPRIINYKPYPANYGIIPNRFRVKIDS